MASTGKRQELYQLNIKVGLPKWEEARINLATGLSHARALGYDGVKVIHGYGSSGAGGVLREHTRHWLDDQRYQCKIADYIPGEQWNIFNPDILYALERCPFLKKDHDLVFANPGITIVLLKKRQSSPGKENFLHKRLAKQRKYDIIRKLTWLWRDGRVGRRRMIGNHVYGQPYQGFESLFLRQKMQYLSWDGYCTIMCL